MPNWRWFQKLGFSVGVCGFATRPRRPGCQRLDTSGGTGRNENRKSRPISPCLRLRVSISIHGGWRVSLFCSRSAAADLLVRTAVMRQTGEDHLVRKRERPESLMPGPPLPDTPVVTRAPGPFLESPAIIDIRGSGVFHGYSQVSNLPFTEPNKVGASVRFSLRAGLAMSTFETITGCSKTGGCGGSVPTIAQRQRRAFSQRRFRLISSIAS